MTDNTIKQRQRSYRERQREAGLVPVQVWVRPEHAQKVKDLAKQLNGDNKMSDSESRIKFEKFVTRSPFNRCIDRHSEGSAWAGEYKDGAVELAWQCWLGAPPSRAPVRGLPCGRVGGALNF